MAFFLFPVTENIMLIINVDVLSSHFPFSMCRVTMSMYEMPPLWMVSLYSIFKPCEHCSTEHGDGDKKLFNVDAKSFLCDPFASFPSIFSTVGWEIPFRQAYGFLWKPYKCDRTMAFIVCVQWKFHLTAIWLASIRLLSDCDRTANNTNENANSHRQTQMRNDRERKSGNDAKWLSNGLRIISSTRQFPSSYIYPFE